MKKLLAAALVVTLLGWAALAGTEQINVLAGWPTAIDGTQPCWIQHGMTGIERALVKELGYRSPRDLALDTTTVTLYVDGIEISPTGVRTPARAPRNDKTSVFEILFFWRFPAKYFEPGIREFTVHWVTTLGGFSELWKTLYVDVQY